MICPTIKINTLKNVDVLHTGPASFFNFREIRNFMAHNAHRHIISTKFSQNIKLKMPSCQSEQVKKVFTIDLMCTSLTFHEVG